MPVYLFRCAECRVEHEALLPLGDTASRPCPACGGCMHHRFARVAVKYAAFGFAATDALAAGPGADFRTLSTTAEEIADS